MVVLLFPDGVMGIAKQVRGKLAERAVRLPKTRAVEGEQV